MKTLIKIAWRNIWRNPRRSWVLITTIAVGVIGYVLTTSFIRGFMFQMVDSTIELQGGHIQVAAEGFLQNPSIRLFIREPQRVEEKLAQIPDIVYAPLVAYQGMAYSSETASGVLINGVDPKREPEISIIARQIVDGRYLSQDGHANEVVLGEGLAKRLDLRVGERMVLMANALDNNLASAAFRVAGIFRTVSPQFDKTFVFIHVHEAQAFVGYDGAVTGFSVRLPQDANLEQTKVRIQEALQGMSLEVKTWKDRNPLLVISLKTFEAFIFLFIIIVFAAIAFSIVNSFLMVIYERIREIGVMMALGVHPRKIRALLFWETLFLAAVGSAVGFAVAAVVVGYFRHFGLDLSVISGALGKFGISAVVYPGLVLSDVVVGLILINILVSLSVIYPAIKASRFNVVDAINFA